jgi:hypothetical protein
VEGKRKKMTEKEITFQSSGFNCFETKNPSPVAAMG